MNHLPDLKFHGVKERETPAFVKKEKRAAYVPASGKSR
jgi:hypothetical protein